MLFSGHLKGLWKEPLPLIRLGFRRKKKERGDAKTYGQLYDGAHESRDPVKSTRKGDFMLLPLAGLMGMPERYNCSSLAQS